LDGSVLCVNFNYITLEFLEVAVQDSHLVALPDGKGADLVFFSEFSVEGRREKLMAGVQGSGIKR